jgi:hypothetical protein
MEMLLKTLKPNNAEITILISKLKPLQEFAEASKDEVVRSFDGFLTQAMESFFKSYMRALIKKKKSKEEICTFLGLSDKLFDELYEEIEDEDLLKIAEKRIEEAGGLEKMREDSFTAEEVMAHWGITQEDLDNCEDWD